MLLTALSFFTAGSIITSLALNFTVLLIGRCVQGIGGGGLIALTYVIVTDMVSLRDRGKWFGLISLQWAIGSITGQQSYAFLEIKLSKLTFEQVLYSVAYSVRKWLGDGIAFFSYCLFPFYKDLLLIGFVGFLVEYSILRHCLYRHTSIFETQSEDCIYHREVEEC